MLMAHNGVIKEYEDIGEAEKYILSQLDLLSQSKYHHILSVYPKENGIQSIHIYQKDLKQEVFVILE